MNLFLALVLAATLPMPGTKLKELPPGKAKADVEAACYHATPPTCSFSNA